MRVPGLIAAILLASCGSNNSSDPATPSATPPPSPSPSPTPSLTPTPSPSPTPTPSPPPPPGSLVVRGTPRGEHIAIEVLNAGTTAVRLQRGMEVQREERGRWIAVSTAGLALRWDCEQPTPADCLTLEAGATFEPPDWLGTQGDAQCICTRCARAPAGRYRFVLRACEGDARIESEPFDLAP